MSVWFVIPSARPIAEVNACTAKWRERGYRVALWRDRDEDGLAMVADLAMVPVRGGYPGYGVAVNSLARHILTEDPDCEWIVTGGDDTLPDPRDPTEIAAECTEQFGGTFGVMQPTGDLFHDSLGRIIERIAGSPWLGREWCLRANQGKGPFHPGFTHMFGDQCLMETAEKLGVFWRRPDLTHTHNHFTRVGDGARAAVIPDHLKWCNTPQHWNEMQALFNRLKADGFRECMPLPELVTA